jgi:DNA-binding Xre family transcriptional regulator
VTTDSDNPEVLRQEIRAILDRVNDRGSLLYFHWLLDRIIGNAPLPAIEELKKLHGAFVRVAEGFRDKTKEINHADFELVVKYVSTGGVNITRPLGMAVKFYREERRLTRLQLSKRCRVPLRAIIALERGQVKDLSIPRFEQLAKGLGVDPGDLISKVMDFEKAKR